MKFRAPAAGGAHARGGRRCVVCESLESRMLFAAAMSDQAVVEPLRVLAAQAATEGNVDGLTPQQVRTAYGIDRVRFSRRQVPGDGRGQTIAIVDPFGSPTIAADLETFNQQFGLPPSPSFTVVGQTGGSAASIPVDAGWATETALDVQWAHAIAPRARILLVAANSDQVADVLTAIDYARHAPGVSVVSMSFGTSEFPEQASLDSLFTTPAGHQGVTFVAASGNQGPFDGPSWPATAPGVLSVGGTTLELADAAGTYGGETAWSFSTGGLSGVIDEPDYQRGVQQTGVRSNPDVAYNADPTSGFAVFSSLADAGMQGWQVVGGTSAGAAQWAGVIAIADQGRTRAGRPTLDGAADALPALYQASADQLGYAIAFHDITDGATSPDTMAGPGYDLVTGIGSPRAKGAIATLLSA